MSPKRSCKAVLALRDVRNTLHSLLPSRIEKRLMRKIRCLHVLFLLKLLRKTLLHNFCEHLKLPGVGAEEGMVIVTQSCQSADKMIFTVIMFYRECYRAAQADITQTPPQLPPFLHSTQCTPSILIPLPPLTLSLSLFLFHCATEKSLGLYQILSTWLNKRKTICITFLGINTFLSRAVEYGH